MWRDCDDTYIQDVYDESWMDCQSVNQIISVIENIFDQSIIFIWYEFLFWQLIDLWHSFVSWRFLNLNICDPSLKKMKSIKFEDEDFF